MKKFSAILLSLCVVACTRQSPNKFSDDLLVKIYDLKDRRSTDTLLTFLGSPNPLYRQEAALAFASVQDSAASIALGTALLEDVNPEVRINAAFALGQTDGFQATNALIPALTDKDRRVVREVLEALGKTIEREDVRVLLDFHSEDTLLQEGQSWAYYQLALRKMADSIVMKSAAAFLTPANSFQTRLAAAHFFSRSQKIAGNGFKDNLVHAGLEDEQSEVRMAAVNGFRHLDMTSALPLLEKIYTADHDYRVRISAVRASQNFSDDKDQKVIFSALRDSVEMVQVAAAEALRNIANNALATKIKDATAEVSSPRALANLYAALLKSGQSEIMSDLLKRYPSEVPYIKSALLSALGESLPPQDQKAFELLSTEVANKSNEKVVLTSAAAALVALDNKKGGGVKKDFLSVYQAAIAQGDVAVIGTICSALVNESLNYREEIKDLQFLYDAKAKFVLPRDIESLQPLEEAIAFLEGTKMPKPIENEFNHPIDWTLVKTIRSDQKVEIRTTKGTIVIRLLVEEAPGSTANFVSLVNNRYFDGKFFHRVVPNFVIQTGCNRGDGYGSEDYSIRSEFLRRRYVTGSVGMASAGKDTEGTQWFITHSPTPHLNGKYTIFAEVESGIDVVHRMEVGDRILETRLKNGQ